jgi:hypothetical protein
MKCKMVISARRKMVFVAREASRRYSNRCPFDSHAPTRVRNFKNRASCVGYPDGQANCPAFQRKAHRRRDSHAADDTCCGLINMYRTHHQPSVTSGETYQKIEDSVKSINGIQCMKSGFNGGVRSVSVDQPVPRLGTKITRLMACSGASDDTINMHPS